jgi:serine/threonine-protein kinase
MSTENIANSDTLVSDIGRDATLAVQSGRALPALPSTRTLDTSLRTTVLPRVELVGEQSHIVADGKVRYELSHRLGEGGVGEVIKARDNDIDRDVAIKRLRPEMQSSHATLLRFAEEVRTVGRLEHPNIVPIHDVGVDPNGEYFFVMKYVHGETLETIIEKLAAGDPAYHAKYDMERRVEIMMGILEAIAYAHSQNIIHRDIKPANVMVGPYGEVMVMDWGLARAMRGPEPVHADVCETPDTSGSKKLFETQLGTLLGTPAYMSPEQARGEELDVGSDIYSLSVLFYELLSLRHPHEEVQTLDAMLEAVKTAQAPYALMQSTAVQPPVPADLSWFVERGMRKDKAERYPSVEAMVERLRHRAGGDFPIQCPITFTMRLTTIMRRSIGRHPFLMSAVILLGSAATFALAVVGVIELAWH